MSDLNTLITRLNAVLSWELAGVVQYMNHAAVLTGIMREPYRKFFAEGAEEAHEHAQIVSDKIVALGGVPTVEPAKIRPAAKLEDMLRNTLALEKDALAAWEAAWEVGEAANKGTAFWLEEHIAEEQMHVDELNRLLSEVGAAGASAGSAAG